MGGSFASILDGCRPLFPPELLDSGGWERLLDRARLLPRSVLDTISASNSISGSRVRTPISSSSCSPARICRDTTSARARAPNGGRRPPPSRQDCKNRPGIRIRTSPVPCPAWCWSTIWPDSRRAGRRLPPGSSCRRGAPPPDRGTAFPGTGIPRACSRRWPPPSAGTVTRGCSERSSASSRRCRNAATCSMRAPSPRVPRGHSGFFSRASPGRRFPPCWSRWNGPARPARRRTCSPRWTNLVDYIAVSLDVSARGTGPRLGLELYRPLKWFAVDRTGWRPFIARLEELGWCLPAKAEGLRRWPGAERLRGNAEIHLVRQGINHVKAVVERAPGRWRRPTSA